MPKLIHVCDITFRDETSENIRGFSSGSINEGVIIFTWENSNLMYPLDTIKSIVTTQEEE